MAARLCLGLGILAYIAYSIDADEAVRFPDDFAWGYCMAAGLLFLLDRIIGAYRWSVVIGIKNSEISFRKVMAIYFKSSFLGHVIPTSLGGEVMKIYGLSRETSRTIEAASSIVVERFIGLCALLAVCGIGFMFMPEAFTRNQTVAAIRGLYLLALIGFVGLAYACTLLLRYLHQRHIRIKNSFLQRIVRISEVFTSYRHHGGRLRIIFALSSLIHIGRVLSVYFVGLSLGFDVTGVYYFFFVPIVALVSMIPVSLAGLGIQEGAFVYFFSLSGLLRADIFTMAILVRVLTLAVTLPGLYFMLERKR